MATSLDPPHRGSPPGRFDRDLIEEIDFHQAMLERDQQQRGLEPAMAAKAARRQLGNTLAAREASRAPWPLIWFDAVRADVRVTVRGFLHARAFAGTAVLTFALGIGANIAVLTALDRLMFRPLPFPESDRLVQLHMYTVASASPYAMLSGDIGAQVAARATTIRKDLAFAKAADLERTIDGFGNAPVSIALATANLLRVLNIRPLLGRDFTPDDARPFRPREILLTYGAWRSRFAASEAVIDRVIGTGTSQYRIVGVLPRDFIVPSSLLAERTDALEAWNNVFASPRPGEFAAAPIARLAPGATVARAQAEISSIVGDLGGTGSTAQARIVVQPLQRGLFFLHAQYLWLIVAAVVLVLVVACVNLATLLLAHGRSRERETAMRAALGASPARLKAAAFLEPVVLCAAGGMIALLMCWWAQSTLVAIMPPAFRSFAAGGLDLRLVGIALAVTLGCALLSGLVPVVMGTRTDLVTVLRRSDHGGGFRLRGSATLLTIEAAVAVLLVAGAAATVPGFARLVLKDPGFEPANLYAITVNHGANNDGEQRYVSGRVRDVLDIVRTQPGVVAAGAVTQLPLGGEAGFSAFWRGLGIDGGEWGISSQTFEALGTRIVQGRDFTTEEIDAGSPVAVVNERGARRLSAGQVASSVVGQIVNIADHPFTVIGIAEDIRPLPGVQAQPALFVPVTSERAPVDQTGLIVAVRMAVGHVPDVKLLAAHLEPRFGPGPVRLQRVSEELLEPWLHRPRFLATLFGGLGAISLFLAAVGVFAVARCEMSRRRHEMAVRTALGASRGTIRILALRRSVQPVAVGVLLGTVAAWWGAEYLQALVFDVDASGLWTLGGGAAAILLAAVLAGWSPARRMALVDPARMLRES